MKHQEKLQAVELRKKFNYSIYTISKKLNVSKSTVAEWLKSCMGDDYKPLAYKDRTISIESIQKMRDGAELGRKNRIYTKKDISNMKSWINIRKRIFQERGRKCEKCNWAETNPYNGFIPVQINHIDGNKKNNTDSNLEILCPNCHSLSKHFMFYGRKRKNIKTD